MRVSPLIKDILDKAFDGAILIREEILHMLRIPLPSFEAGLVIASADWGKEENNDETNSIWDADERGSTRMKR